MNRRDLLRNIAIVSTLPLISFDLFGKEIDKTLKPMTLAWLEIEDPVTNSFRIQLSEITNYNDIDNLAKNPKFSRFHIPEDRTKITKDGYYTKRQSLYFWNYLEK